LSTTSRIAFALIRRGGLSLRSAYVPLIDLIVPNGRLTLPRTVLLPRDSNMLALL
jgi:hypothetical protein